MSSPSRDTNRSLDDEIQSALDGVDLQSVDLPSRTAKKGSERLMPGTVVDVRGDDVFVELGPRMQGIAASTEFDAPPKVGDRFDFMLRGREDDSLWRLSLRAARELAAWDELEVGSHVKARVTGQNTGGLELAIGSNKAFMPASQVDLGSVEDLSKFLGETMVARVLEVDRQRNRVVLSRRAVLDDERRESRERAADDLSVGSIVSGKVTRLESFGAFIDLGGGLEGLAHVSNLSRKRVEKAEDVVSIGQDVRAMVLEVKDGGRRIGLGLKQLEPDPWEFLPPTLNEESVVTGKVVRIAEFGAFMEISPGIEGLCHVSQMGLGGGRRRPEEAVKVGQELTVRIVSIEPDRQRIGLSLLDRRGAKLGSEEAVDENELREALHNEARPLGTNLGALFKRALES